MAKLSAVTVTWNSVDVVSGLLESLAAQGTDVSEVTVVDNASTDGTREIVGRILPGAHIIENHTNTGFAAAANQGIAASSGEYILLVNPDISFGPDFVGRLVEAIEADTEAGSCAPKLVRPEGRVIDSAGLSMSRTRKAVDRGRDKPDTGSYDSPCRVFGASGAAALYRRAALDDCRIDGEYFDESFFAYKEDVDLAWRMNLLGWKCLYVPDATATHGRGWKVASRKDIPRFVRRHSFKNHYLTILKNDDVVNMLIHLPWVLAYDTALFFYALLREPFLLGGIADVIRLMPRMERWRIEIMLRRRLDPAGMRRLFG